MSEVARALKALVAVDEVAGGERLAARIRAAVGAPGMHDDDDGLALLGITRQAEAWLELQGAGKAFDESKHPRGFHGRWGHGTGHAVTAARASSAARPATGRVRVQSVKVATTRLRAGAPASVTPADATKLAAELAKDGAAALQRLTVTGQPNLFTKHAREIPRSDMPQIPTDAPTMQKFMAHLASKGFEAHLVDVPPGDLTATQNQLDGAKVGQMLAKFDPKKWRAVLTDHAGNVADGHHRWAAAALYALDHPGYKVQALQIDANIDQLLAAMHNFDQKGEQLDFGAPAKAAA